MPYEEIHLVTIDKCCTIRDSVGKLCMKFKLEGSLRQYLVRSCFVVLEYVGYFFLLAVIFPKTIIDLFV